MENEFKGTKGKWVCGQKHHDQITETYSVYHKGDLIHAGLSPRVYAHVSKEQSKANAQLISKAPEMLEMLKSIHKATKDAQRANGKLVLSMRMLEFILEKTPELIKEATTI